MTQPSGMDADLARAMAQSLAETGMTQPSGAGDSLYPLPDRAESHRQTLVDLGGMTQRPGIDSDLERALALSFADQGGVGSGMTQQMTQHGGGGGGGGGGHGPSAYAASSSSSSSSRGNGMTQQMLNGQAQPIAGFETSSRRFHTTKGNGHGMTHRKPRNSSPEPVLSEEDQLVRSVHVLYSWRGR